MKIRLKEYNKGWVVEYKKAYWSIFGLKYKWIPCVKSSITGEPHYSSLPKSARNLLFKKMEFDLKNNHI
jgi:hypothetical protein